jgi:hypothetical protein
MTSRPSRAIGAPFSLGVRAGNRGLAVMINLSLSLIGDPSRQTENMPAAD